MEIEGLFDGLGIEDRYPADPEPLGARGEPERLNGGDHRIADGFRHGLASEAVPDVGFLVGADDEVHGRLRQPLELEPHIARLPLAGIAVQCRLVRLGEILADRRAQLRCPTRTKRQGWLSPTDGA